MFHCLFLLEEKMRYVFKLMVLAAFVAGTTLAVGCGETASTDTKPKADTEGTSMSTPESVDGNVSQVSFDVTGMT